MKPQTVHPEQLQIQRQRIENGLRRIEQGFSQGIAIDEIVNVTWTEALRKMTLWEVGQVHPAACEQLEEIIVQDLGDLSYFLSRSMDEDLRLSEIEKIIRKIFSFYQAELSLTAVLLFTRLLQSESHPHQNALANMHGFQAKEITRELSKFRTELRRRKIEREREFQFNQQYHTVQPLTTEQMKNHPKIGKQNAALWQKLRKAGSGELISDRFAAARFTPEQRAQYERDFGKSA